MTQQSEEDRTRTYGNTSFGPRDPCALPVQRNHQPDTVRYGVRDLGTQLIVVGDNWEKGGVLEVSHSTGSRMAAKTSIQSGSTRSGPGPLAAALHLAPQRSCSFSLCAYFEATV